MALWARTQQLTGSYLRDVQELYRTRFPIEVRHSIAQWLESQDWRLIDENNDEATAYHMLEQMEMQINEKANAYMHDEQSFPFRLRLLDTASGIKMAYKDYPLELVRLIRESLFREEQLVLMCTNEPMKQENQVSQTERKILTDLETLRNDVAKAGTYVKDLHQKHEYFVIQFQQNHKTEDLLKALKAQNAGGDFKKQQRIQQQIKNHEMENTNLKTALRSGAMDIKNLRTKTYQHMKDITSLFATLCHMVFDVELISWKNLQRQSTFKSDHGFTLTKIQRWCEELASLLNDCKQQVMKLQMLEGEIKSDGHSTCTVEELDKELRSLLNILLRNSFVVDRQPPQVIRKDAKFTANVRLLVGHKLNVFMSMPTVEASIISEPQARRIVSDGCIGDNMENAGDILNNKGTMEYTPGQGQMSIAFRNMQLKKIKRADRKGQELVVEEKFCILFRAVIQADRKYESWTMSLPIVVTVHGNQECQAQATILWDNAFSDPRRIPFTVPDQANWTDLSTLLSCWYHLKTDKGLSFDHLQILAAKLFGESNNDYSANMVSRSQFHKDHLQPGKCNFTLWEWIYSVQKLTRDHLKEAWVDGHIMGFVSKKTAQEILMATPPGTFLLRYSDTELGGISIVYNEHVPGQDTMHVCNLCPFTDKDFKIRSLADRIKDLDKLWTLYPATPKNVAFGKYWSRNVDAVQQSVPGDYIPHTLSMTIPNASSTVNPANVGGTTPDHLLHPPLSASSMDFEYPDDELATYLSPGFNQSDFNDVLADFVPGP